jgi:hypothetical protein
MVFGSSLNPSSLFSHIIQTNRFYARMEDWKIAEFAQNSWVKILPDDI